MHTSFRIRTGTLLHSVSLYLPSIQLLLLSRALPESCSRCILQASCLQSVLDMQSCTAPSSSRSAADLLFPPSLWILCLPCGIRILCRAHSVHRSGSCPEPCRRLRLRQTSLMMSLHPCLSRMYPLHSLCFLRSPLSWSLPLFCRARSAQQICS